MLCPLSLIRNFTKLLFPEFSTTMPFSWEKKASLIAPSTQVTRLMSRLDISIGVTTSGRTVCVCAKLGMMAVAMAKPINRLRIVGNLLDSLQPEPPLRYGVCDFVCDILSPRH